MNEAPVSELSIYDRLRRSDQELSDLLASGSARRELTAVFGAGEYAVLAALARAAQRVQRHHAEPVYILPGIMGTQLGSLRDAPTPADLLWLDPQDITAGGLERLRLPGAAALHPLGAIPYSYLPLQLRLRVAGYNVVMHEYDWRTNLRDAARELSMRLCAEPAASVSIIAHSMGGLISRGAMRLPGFERVRRLITLGVPHQGSFGAVQAIRGTYPVVRRLAALDRLHDAEMLATRVFSTFPSIHQLLPGGTLSAHGDLFEIGRWPRSGPQPDLALLSDAREFVGTLAPCDERCIAISGTHQRTVVDLRLDGDDFEYQIGDGGDGTVPMASAQLPAGQNYYVRCEHSELPRSVSVARAIVELLRRGRTTRLSDRRALPRGRTVTVTDAALRTTWNEKVDWASLGPAARRTYLNRLNQPPPHYAARHARRRRPRHPGS